MMNQINNGNKVIIPKYDINKTFYLHVVETECIAIYLDFIMYIYILYINMCIYVNIQYIYLYMFEKKNKGRIKTKPETTQTNH